VTRDEFIEGNLPLVHKLANRFRGRGVEYDRPRCPCSGTECNRYRNRG